MPIPEKLSKKLSQNPENREEMKNMNPEKIGVKVSEAKVGVSTNSSHLLEREKFYWLDTNFLSVDFVPFEEAMDSYMEIEDVGGVPCFKIERSRLMVKGDFSKWEKEIKDKRYTLFGNLGIFSSWVLRTLEEEHDISTFHACALVKGERLVIISGGAGAGKTVFILSALKKGWKIFSTEFVHFRVKDKVEFFKGPIRDAVRVDTFRYHFPEMVEDLGINLREETGSKLVVDFSPFQVREYKLIDPEIILIFPHVEEKRERVIRKEIKDREILLRNLFNNASEKMEKSLLLYGKWAIPGLDTFPLAEKRRERLEKFLERGRVKESFLWVSGVKEVMKIV